MNKKSAMTLSEVLITLGIIGIVASMTIPSLLNATQEQEYKTAYKKAYSVASQAWLSAYNDGGLSLCSELQDSSSTCNSDNFAAFKTEMKVIRDCGTDTASCWNMSGEKVWQGEGNLPVVGSTAFIDASGMAWSQTSTSGSVAILVDTNGNKFPNQYGKDRAVFYFFYNTDTKFNFKTNVPAVFLCSDFPTSDTTTWPTWDQTRRCPSMGTHPCYYTSWITGSK